MTIHLNPLATIVGLMVIFSFVVATWKLFRFIFKVDRALPTLLNIAGQFENNGGTTLKDGLDKINTKLDKLTQTDEELKIQDRVVLKIAEDSRLIAQTNSKIVNELSMAQTEDIKHIRDYLHSKLHEINNTLSITNLQAKITEKQAQRIENRLDKLLPFVVRHRETDDEIIDSQKQQEEGKK